MPTYARAYPTRPFYRCSPSTVLVAQDLYTVRAGVFRDVQREDFKEIKDLGYLYSLEAGARETEVYVGAFTDEEKANAVITALSAQGFRNALVQRLPATAGVPSAMIQFALHDTRLPVQWEKVRSPGPAPRPIRRRDVKNSLPGPTIARRRRGRPYPVRRIKALAMRS